MVQAIDNIVTKAPLRGIRLAIGPAEALLPEEPVGPTHEEQLAEQDTAGHQRGRDEAAAEYEPQLAALRTELEAAKAEGANQQLATIEETVQSQLAARLNELEAELIEFSTEAAIRLVHGLPISTGVIEAAIRETLEHCEQDAEVSVHLHPEDLKNAEESSERAATGFAPPTPRAVFGGQGSFPWRLPGGNPLRRHRWPPRNPRSPVA